MKSSLNKVLTLNFILGGVLPVVFIAMLILPVLSFSIKDRIKKENQLLVNSFFAKIDLFLHHPIHSMFQLEPLFTNYNQIDNDQFHDLILPYIGEKSYFKTIIFLTLAGKVEHTFPRDEDYMGLDMSRQPYYQKTLFTSELYWSQVFFSPQTGHPAITVSKRISGGIIAAEIDLLALSRFTNSFSGSLDSEIILYEPDGTIIAHPSNELVAGRVNINSIYHFSAADDTGIASRVIGGEKRRVLVSRIQIASTGWTLLVSQPLERVFGALLQLQVILFICFMASLFLAIWLAYRSRQAAMQPFTTLLNSVGYLATGEYDKVTFKEPYEEFSSFRKGLARVVEAIRSREATIRSKEKEAKLYFDLGLVGMAKISVDGKWLEVNSCLSQMLGISESSLFGQSIWQHSTSEMERREEYYLQAIGAGFRDGYVIEKQFIQPNGEVRDTITAVNCIRSGNGNPSYYIGIIQDITERKRAEKELLDHQSVLEQEVAKRTHSLQEAYEKLKDSEIKYTDLYEKSPSMYATIRMSDTIITECNATLAEKLGLEKSDIVGSRSFSIYHEDSIEHLKEASKSFLENGELKETELVLKTKDGTPIPVLLTATSLKSDAGEILSSRSCWTDISTQKEHQRMLAEITDALKSSNEELQQFAYVASHDLQEPLRMISSYTELLVKKYSDTLDDKAKNYLAYASDGAHRMNALILDLLEFSRVKTRAEKLVEVELDSVATAAVRNLEKRIKDTNAQVVINELPRVLGDKTQLIQLFQNLIGNGVKFHGGDSPVVDVVATTSDETVQIDIVDNGIGIEPRFYDKIFVIFQRLHTRDEYPGTGIGLALCKRIIEHHNGRIWCSSEKGQGTTFSFTLQLATNNTHT